MDDVEDDVEDDGEQHDVDGDELVATGDRKSEKSRKEGGGHADDRS